MHPGRMRVQGLPERRGQRLACTIPNEQQKSRHEQTPRASNGDKDCIVKGEDGLKLLVEMAVIKDGPDGRREAHGTCQEKQESSHQVAACTVDQTLGQFDVRHGGPEGRVAHSNQAEQQGTHCDHDAERQGKLEDAQVQLVNRQIPSAVVHQAVTASVIPGTLDPQARVNCQVLLVSVERDQPQLPPVGKQSPRKEARYRGNPAQEGQDRGCVDISAAHGRRAWAVWSVVSKESEFLQTACPTPLTPFSVRVH